MRFFILLLLIFLSGCAGRGTLIWEHSEKLGDLQLQQAQKECRQIAQREVRYPYYYYYGDPLFPLYYHDRHYAYGSIWHSHFAQMRYQEELSRLYRICMEAKGWQLVRISGQEPSDNSKTDSRDIKTEQD